MRSTSERGIEAFSEAELRALKHWLHSSKDGKDWLELEKRREQVKGQSVAEAGLNLVVWSKEFPSSGRQIFGRVAPIVIATGLGLLTSHFALDTQAALNSLPPNLDGFIRELASPNFRLTNPAALAPSFDFSNIFDIKVRLPEPGVAFDPVVADHQRRVNEVFDIVKQGAAKTATLAAETTLAGIGTIFTAIKYHPFREIKSNGIFLSQPIGELIYHLGRVIAGF